MIPIGVMSIPQFILLFIFPLLGAISIFIWLIYGLNKLIQRKAALVSNHQPKSKKPRSKKWIAFVIFTLIVNSWNAYMCFKLYGIYQQSMTQEKNKDKRSRFILSQDFQYDQFLFPKGTLINLYNVHDTGKNFEPLSLYGLDKAKFPIPVYIAGVWTDTIDLNSDFDIFCSCLRISRLHLYISKMARVAMSKTNSVITCLANRGNLQSSLSRMITIQRLIMTKKIGMQTRPHYLSPRSGCL